MLSSDDCLLEGMAAAAGREGEPAPAAVDDDDNNMGEDDDDDDDDDDDALSEGGRGDAAVIACEASNGVGLPKKKGLCLLGVLGVFA